MDYYEPKPLGAGDVDGERYMVVGAGWGHNTQGVGAFTRGTSRDTHDIFQIDLRQVNDEMVSGVSDPVSGEGAQAIYRVWI